MLLSVSARTAKILSVGVHITESHKVKKIQKIINALEIDKKIISAQIFLFSLLLMLEKNIHKHIREAMRSPTKWRLKSCGLIIVSRFDVDLGKYIPVSKENDT
ncbi:hypothetical protein IKI14_04770 [bacterium]|nr:hypothetical protein [bacterium]